MTTLQKFNAGLETIPATTSWYLSDISESKGKQELYTKQSPQRLESLKEHALIESAISSNRIEGVEVDQKRIGTIIFGQALLQDRSEEEVRGYREALNLIHSMGAKLPVSEETCRKLHLMTRGEIWDAGKYKEKESDIIEKRSNGTSSIRFKTIPAKLTPDAMQTLHTAWKEAIKEAVMHRVVSLAAYNLDFLCIHPFRDGNGRVSRLLMLLQCYQSGIEVGRYISLERLIEQNKERYYETLKISSDGWHEGKHNPWHYINFLCFIIKSAYKEFEERLGNIPSPRGEKTDLVRKSVNSFHDNFSVADLKKKLPVVSVDMIRRILKEMQDEGLVECLNRGRSAKWRKIGN